MTVSLGLGASSEGRSPLYLAMLFLDFWIWASSTAMRARSDWRVSWKEVVSYTISTSPGCTSSPSLTLMELMRPSFSITFCTLPVVTLPSSDVSSPQ